MELQTFVQFACRNQKAIQEMQLKVLQMAGKRENWRKIPTHTKNLPPFPGVYLQSQDLHDVISYLKVRQVKIYNDVIVDSSAFQNIFDSFNKFLQT